MENFELAKEALVETKQAARDAAAAYLAALAAADRIAALPSGSPDPYNYRDRAADAVRQNEKELEAIFAALQRTDSFVNTASYSTDRVYAVQAWLAAARALEGFERIGTQNREITYCAGRLVDLAAEAQAAAA
jgi:aminoglycoside phosphotransferase (APT) family kinase protein